MQEITAKRGDRVSLNTLKRSFYFQGEGGINLNYNNESSTIIPDSATDEHLKQINMAIVAGGLLLGDIENRVEIPDRDSDLKVLLESGRNKICNWIRDLREDKSIKKEYKISTLEKLAKFEKEGKNRASVLADAERALSMIGGVSPVEETQVEKIEIKLTNGNQEEPAKG